MVYIGQQFRSFQDFYKPLACNTSTGLWGDFTAAEPPPTGHDAHGGGPWHSHGTGNLVARGDGGGIAVYWTAGTGWLALGAHCMEVRYMNWMEVVVVLVKKQPFTAS